MSYQDTDFRSDEYREAYCKTLESLTAGRPMPPLMRAEVRAALDALSSFLTAHQEIGLMAFAVMGKVITEKMGPHASKQ
ncbi:hypothetical protein [uncultured Hymenobacter sp.]|uniref:hypothetical protein n=1 Tax=uncultured Hymenobacter sp. TaxID=170016 RepID=UPI0035CA0134